MFTGKMILDFNRNRDNKIEAELENSYLVKRQSTMLNKAKLYKINKEIDKIISGIKKESYWDYINGEFIYKSDFQYDSKLQDIIFTINCVKREDKKYISANNSQREQNFIFEYQEVLKRLAILETKKAELYEAARVMPIDRAIYSDKKAKKVPFNKNEQYKREKEYMSKLAENFVNSYGSEIIGQLIYLLNKTDNTKEPINIYNVLSKGKSTDAFKRDLFTWISTYSNPGKEFLSTYFDEHYYGPARLNKPNYEDVVTNNMIKLHLY